MSAEITSFSDFFIHDRIEKSLEKLRLTIPTDVQKASIPHALDGKDLQVCAETGSGKTLAYVLPMIQKFLGTKSVIQGTRGLVLVPTRELARQVFKATEQFTDKTGLSVGLLTGGEDFKFQAAMLRKNPEFIIATPGRLVDHIKRRSTDLVDLEVLVLDEADRMLDMGFITDVKTIFQHTAKQRQTLLFSATLSGAVNELAHKILKNHETIRVSRQNVTADTVEHVLYPVEERRKIDLFMKLLAQYNWFQILVFTSTKEQADRLMANLKQKKIDAAVCHGDKSQGSRRRALADFKDAKIQVLISTEIAARGLDIEGLEYVLNFNLPFLAEDYVHRIGRTGRAGKEGLAISFVSREEERTLDSIERLIGTRIRRIVKPGFEVSNRDSLIKTVSRSVRSTRSNKSSQARSGQRYSSLQNSGKNKAAKSGAGKIKRKK